MNDSLKHLVRLNKENARAVTVNVGLLRGAIKEIEAHAAVNGKGVFTDMVLNGLQLAIERAQS